MLDSSKQKNPWGQLSGLCLQPVSQFTLGVKVNDSFWFSTRLSCNINSGAVATRPANMWTDYKAMGSCTRATRELVGDVTQGTYLCWRRLCGMNPSRSRKACVNLSHECEPNLKKNRGTDCWEKFPSNDLHWGYTHLRNQESPSYTNLNLLGSEGKVEEAKI